MAVTTTSQVDPGIQIYYDRVLLKRALPFLHYNKFGQLKSISKKSGDTIKFRRYNSLTVNPTPVAEGVTPSLQQLNKTDILAQVSWYMNGVAITDVIDLTVEDPVLTEATEILGENMGQVIDMVTRDILCATASYTNASGGSNGQTPTEMTRSDIDAVVKTLVWNNAKPITEVQKASTGIGTAPIRAAYMSIIHTDLIDDLEKVSGFKSVAEYPKGDGMEGEWGAVGNVRFLVSSVAHKSADATPKYYCLVIGKDAYGITDIKGGTAKTIIHGFGSGGVADPFNRLATAAWKTQYVARILNDNFIQNLRVTHS